MNILCPKCRNILYKVDNTYKCINNHSYDIARQGYINLNMHNSQNTGDNPLMIQARTNFLNKGYYHFLLEKINSLLKEDETLVDLACGEGYYTSKFICKDKIGIDLSKQGLKYASRNDPNTIYLLNSIFHNPLEDKCADKVITIFAPVAKQEVLRLLKDDGKFILVKPDEYHLFELKQALYDKPYLNEVEDIEIPGLVIDQHIKINNKSLLNNEDINNLFMMTPYYNTSSLKDKEKLKDIKQLSINFSFIIDIYKKI